MQRIEADALIEEQDREPPAELEILFEIASWVAMDLGVHISINVAAGTKNETSMLVSPAARIHILEEAVKISKEVGEQHRVKKYAAAIIKERAVAKRNKNK